MNIKLGWFLLVTMDVITVGNFATSTLSDLLSNKLAVLAFGFELEFTELSLGIASRGWHESGVVSKVSPENGILVEKTGLTLRLELGLGEST